MPVGNVQQRHAQHRAIGRNQRQINTQDAVEQRTGFLDHHFRELDNRGDGDDERDCAQIAQVKGRQKPAVDDIACAGGHRQHKGRCHAHAQRRFEFLRHAHKRAQAENPHQHNVVDENGANDEEYIMGHGLHCCGKGWEVVARGTIPGKTGARFQRLRLSQFVRSPSTRLQPCKGEGILTAGSQGHVATGGEIDELAAHDPAGVGEGLCGDSLNKIAFDEAAVVDVAGDNARVFAAGETGAGRFDGACPASSIDDGDQYVLAVNHARFHPDDVLGELGNLFGRQGNARGEVETLRCIQALWLSILLSLHIPDVISDELAARKPASIGCLRAGGPETHVNTGLEDRQAGNARKQWAGGQPLRRSPFYAGFRAGVAADAVAGLRPQLRLQRD